MKREYNQRNKYKFRREQTLKYRIEIKRKNISSSKSYMMTKYTEKNLTRKRKDQNNLEYR